MDMRKYTGSSFLKIDDVRGAPIVATIVAVSEGKYDKPNLELDDGLVISVNATNAKTLARAYGYDSTDWIGKEIKLALGKVKYQGELQDSILIEPITPSPKPSMNDEIPF